MTDTRTYEDGFRDAMKVANTIIVDLELRWRDAARRLRTHTYEVGWIRRQKRVMPRYETAAQSIDAAVSGLGAIRAVINQRKPNALNLTKDQGGIL